tara:strand:- start:821 stop:997 length:177 start_codon:yes stop_codon:yes gene_type:complete
LYFQLDLLFQVELYLAQDNKSFTEFREVKNGISIRGVNLPELGLIELTHSKDKIWRDL